MPTDDPAERTEAIARLAAQAVRAYGCADVEPAELLAVIYYAIGPALYPAGLPDRPMMHRTRLHRERRVIVDRLAAQDAWWFTCVCGHRSATTDAKTARTAAAEHVMRPAEG
jgi:hypothetical protein